MKEIYCWVPWFAELSRKIADGGEEYLVDRAKRIPWKEGGTEPSLLRYGEKNIDPFSFLYFLTGHHHARRRVYGAVNEIFDLTSELPLKSDEAFIFPTAPLINALFHYGGEGDPVLLWRLFGSAVTGIDSVSAADFESALQIKGVGVKKLTQTLCLVNAEEFLPYDDSTLYLGISGLSEHKNVSWATYRAAIDGMRKAFPGCRPCEINLFAYESAKNNDPLRVNPERCYLISTNVYDDDEDRWEDFSGNNWAFTGGPGKGGWSEYDPEGSGARYEVDEPGKGDILLARFAGQGHGIGVVVKNDYADALADESRLHVIWLNKAERRLSSGPRSVGFGRGHGKIGVAFRQAYPRNVPDSGSVGRPKQGR